MKPTPPRAKVTVVRPEWRWHYRVLTDVRERLLQHQSAELREASEPLEPFSLHLADQATDEFDHDVALAQLSAEQDALYEIEEALRRIQAGTYGLCEKTGQPIGAERLRAIPWTRFCREAEQSLERAGQVAPPHLGRLASVRKRPARTIRPPDVPGQES